MSSRASLIGREKEAAVLDRLVDAVRGGESRALVLRGEFGIGKTTLLEDAVQRASDLQVLRVLSAESEMELPYAGLHQLCGSAIDRLDRLPGAQRDALATALGLETGTAPSRFLVGLAVLGLLADVAEEGPLVCIVDDAQWLDAASAQALAFAARRLHAESIGIFFITGDVDPASDDSEEGSELAGIAEMRVGGLGYEEARALVASTIPGRLDDRVRDRIVAEARGNPLGLLEISQELTPAEIAGGYGLSGKNGLADRIKQSFLRKLRLCPEETTRLLLLAAADPLGDVTLLWRAASLLGLDPEAAEPARAAGLIEIDTRVRFFHPLVRSAVYGAAKRPRRQEAHRALAEATDPDLDDDRLAWHRAQAASGLEEDVAQQLERAAERARRRGGVAAAAAFLARSTELTPDPDQRGRRALAAAKAKFDAAAPDDALELLGIASVAPDDRLHRAMVERLRGQIAFSRTRLTEAATVLVDAAGRLEPLNPTAARETYLEALRAAGSAGRLSDGIGVREVAEAASAAPSTSAQPEAMDLLMDGLAIRSIQGYAAGVEPLQRALQAFRQAPPPSDSESRWLWLACPVAPEPVAPDLWDDATWHELADRALVMARESGALTVLPTALSSRAVVHLFAGELAEASALIEEAESIARSTRRSSLIYPAVLLAAWRGEEAPALEMIERSRQRANDFGEGRALGLAGYATAVLCNGLCQYQSALHAAQQACEHEDLGIYPRALTELVESAVRSGVPEEAALAAEELEERTTATGTSWALGVRARTRALVSTDDGEAGGLYQEALEHFSQCRVSVDLLRTRLVYGEWLRRQGRRADARAQLRPAHQMLDEMGYGAFAERARRELEATGETIRRRSSESVDLLTAQEAQIARLARDGLSNPEIGAQLFISPRTVQYHLRKVFAKLEISSRRQLGRVAPELLNPTVPT